MGIPIGGATVASGTPPKNDLANAVIQGSFVGTGVSLAYSFYGAFNIVLYGPNGPNGNWNATIGVERSFDGGVTWVVCGVGGAGQQAIYASAGTGADVSITASEPEQGVLYRLHCTALSTPVFYRMSTTSPAATAWGIPPG